MIARALAQLGVMKSEPSGCLTLEMPMIGISGPIAARIAVMSATPSARMPTAPPCIAAPAIAAMKTRPVQRVALPRLARDDQSAGAGRALQAPAQATVPG